MLQLQQQTNFYRGKVRDVYSIGTQHLVMVASDRISAFDVILPKPIPHKGQVLTQIAAHMLDATRHLCPNWLLACPAPQAAAGLRCEPFKIEMVIRGTLTGHAWRTYSAGKRKLCGVALPNGMKENEYFAEPIITPSTKAAEGHDEDISAQDLLAQHLCTADQWEKLVFYTQALFAKGREMALERGLILADTKYEFGTISGQIYLMDEVHTPDSSRYFLAEGFEDKVMHGQKPQQLSKEFVREWLMANGFMGQEGQQMPAMTEEWVATISRRYVDLYEKITGQIFEPSTLTDGDLEASINGWINTHVG